MRLAQAARKLSITTEDIVDFLEIRGIAIEKDSNTKLEERAIQLLYKHFEIEEESKPEEIVPQKEVETEKIEEDNQEITEAKNQKIEDLKKETSEEERQVSDEEEAKISPRENIVDEKPIKKSFRTVDEVLEAEGEETHEDFVIKPAKIELKGLNVVGKIDLPEPKPKSDPEQKAESKVKAKKVFPKTRENKSPGRRQKRELSPSEIRKREEQKEARKREQIEKEKKKKREQFYKEKILKPKQIEQKNKPKKGKSVVEDKSTEKKPQPKTILGKFWKWLNT